MGRFGTAANAELHIYQRRHNWNISQDISVLNPATSERPSVDQVLTVIAIHLSSVRRLVMEFSLSEQGILRGCERGPDNSCWPGVNMLCKRSKFDLMHTDWS